VCKSLLIFHWNYVCILRYSASKNGVTLKPGVGIFQGHWKWRRSMNGLYTIFYWSAVLNMALSCTVFELFDVEQSWPWNLGYRSLKVIRTGAIRKLGWGFIFAFHSNYGSILHPFLDKTRYWSKIVIFFYIPVAFDAPVRGVFVGILPSRLVWKKTRMVGLPNDEKNLMICITV